MLPLAEFLSILVHYSLCRSKWRTVGGQKALRKESGHPTGNPRTNARDHAYIPLTLRLFGCPCPWRHGHLSCNQGCAKVWLAEPFHDFNAWHAVPDVPENHLTDRHRRMEPLRMYQPSECLKLPLTLLPHSRQRRCHRHGDRDIARVLQLQCIHGFRSDTVYDQVQSHTA